MKPWREHNRTATRVEGTENMQRHYVGLVHKEEGSDYGISFPDFPGCVSAGSTPEDTFINGREALQFHIDGIVEDNEELPMPQAVEEVDADDAIMVTMTPVILPAKSKRFNVTMDENLLAEIDHVAGNRSAWLADAAKEKLTRRNVA